MFGKIAKSFVFCAIGFVVFVFLGNVLHPFWAEWNNFYTHKGFYEQPKNTVQVAALSSSITIRGFDAMLLYEKHGMCAYNYATEQQPMLGSHFILQEIYRNHSATLQVVVLDCYGLVYEASDAFYRKAIEPLRFSPNKIMVAQEVAAKNYADADAKTRKQKYFNMLSYLCPVLNYHERWKGLVRGDFIKFSEPSKKQHRGHEPNFGLRLNGWKENENVYLPFSETASDEANYNKTSLKYFEKIVNFCKEKNLKLLVYKSPDLNWNVGRHAMVRNLSEKLGFDFLDMNIVDIFEEMKFDFALDMLDWNHPNFWGAQKITDYLGKTIAEKFPVNNISADKKYDFMKKDLELYQSFKDTSLERQTFDEEKYAAYMQKYDFEIEFIKWGMTE